MDILIVLWWAKERANKVFQLLKNNKSKFDYIILSWTKKEDNITKHLVQHYIPEHKLFVERYSRDTITNVFFTNHIIKKLLKNNNSDITLNIVTNPEQFKRAKLIFELKLFGKKLFPSYTIKNIESDEKPWKSENKLIKLFNLWFFFISLWCLYTYITRKIL